MFALNIEPEPQLGLSAELHQDQVKKLTFDAVTDWPGEL